MPGFSSDDLRQIYNLLRGWHYNENADSPQVLLTGVAQAVIKVDDEWKYGPSTLWSCHEFWSERSKSLISSGLEERRSNI